MTAVSDWVVADKSLNLSAPQRSNPQLDVIFLRNVIGKTVKLRENSLLQIWPLEDSLLLSVWDLSEKI